MNFKPTFLCLKIMAEEEKIFDLEKAFVFSVQSARWKKESLNIVQNMVVVFFNLSNFCQQSTTFQEMPLPF